jgi:hypothetical protein
MAQVTLIDVKTNDMMRKSAEVATHHHLGRSLEKSATNFFCCKSTSLENIA